MGSQPSQKTIRQQNGGSSRGATPTGSSQCSMRILFLSRWFPYPADNGSKLRVLNMLRRLSRRHEVSLISFVGEGEQVESSLFALRRYCADIKVLPYRGFRPTSVRALAGLFSMQPRSLVDVHSDEMKHAIAAEISRKTPDLIIASQIDMVPYAIHLRGVPLVLDELEISSIRDAATRATPIGLRRVFTWLKLSIYLRQALPRFAACTVVSEKERAHVRSLAPSYRNLEVLPNAVDLSDYDGDFGTPKRNTLVYSGAITYKPNRDAVGYFAREIFPLILESVHDARFRVTGHYNGAEPASLAHGHRVEYTGRLSDVRPVVARSWASVVPIRHGGGTRFKIIESMALGTPVISTSKGAEGLDVADGVNILIADEPKEFAARVIQLLESPALRQKLAAGGRRLVASKYDWQINGEKLTALVDRAASPAMLR
jgi:glycosyltransferase involved in cell wall biosynthesis